MTEHVVKLPDIGEGVAEAELVEWHVKTGDLVREDTILAAVMTDKATVEIPSPVEGEVLWLGAEVGDMVPVGSALVRLKTAGDHTAAAAPPEREPEPPATAAPGCRNSSTSIRGRGSSAGPVMMRAISPVAGLCAHRFVCRSRASIVSTPLRPT